VITTPLTVFKELIENALDAKATAVSLESAPDLLSYFVVKDNGTGIPHDDRPLMAAPHCTSKIQNYEDISEVATLGFRGEALASLAAISGNLTIATRTEKESVGVACDIGKDGKISRLVNCDKKQFIFMFGVSIDKNDTVLLYKARIKMHLNCIATNL